MPSPRDPRGPVVAAIGLGAASLLTAAVANIADRLDALGGGVDVASAPGRGSTLHGSLPVAQASSVPVEAA